MLHFSPLHLHRLNLGDRFVWSIFVTSLPSYPPPPPPLFFLLFFLSSCFSISLTVIFHIVGYFIKCPQQPTWVMGCWDFPCVSLRTSRSCPTFSKFRIPVRFQILFDAPLLIPRLVWLCENVLNFTNKSSPPPPVVANEVGFGNVFGITLPLLHFTFFFCFFFYVCVLLLFLKTLTP